MTDTTARDQLAQIIYDTLNRKYGDFTMPDDAADEIIRAGWRPPVRTVTTVEELDALAVGTVVMEGDHGTPDDTGWGFKTMPGVFHRFTVGWPVAAGIWERVPNLPVTVLWEPEEGE